MNYKRGKGGLEWAAIFDDAPFSQIDYDHIYKNIMAIAEAEGEL